jgi:hypothetical protein
MMDFNNSKVSQVAKQIQACRDIVREIDNFGINELQRTQVIYLLSLGLENREAMLEISAAAKKYIGNPLEDAEKTQLEV